MDPMVMIMFKRAANAARQAIGKPVVSDYVVERILGPIQRAFETALYQDARAAQKIEKRDLALAEARRQSTKNTEVQDARHECEL